MCQFIETIQVKDKAIQNIEYHNQRFNYTRKSFFNLSAVNLIDFIKLPAQLTHEIYRCRVTYSKEIDNIEFILYKPKTINRLKIVEDNNIKYNFKFADRTQLNNLFEKRAGCDDVLIVKNRKITDTSIANVIFFNGQEWITPLNPLLKGTKRSQLLAERQINEKNIHLSDLNSYLYIRLINALNGDDYSLPISAIEL